MKKLIITILILTMVFTLTACGKTAEKFVLQESTTEVFFDGEVQMHLRTVYEYNETGTMTEMESYQDGELYATAVPTLNDKGLPTEVVYTGADGTVGEIMRYTYDEQGRAVKTEFLTDGTVTQYNENVYDSDDNLVSQTNYHAAIDMTTDFLFRYDTKGNRTERQVLRNSELVTRTVTEYDNKNRILKETTYIGNTDNIQTYVEYTYDDDTSTSTAITTAVSSDYSDSKTITTYDEYGNETMIEHFSDGELRQRIVQLWKQVG